MAQPDTTSVTPSSSTTTSSDSETAFLLEAYTRLRTHLSTSHLQSPSSTPILPTPETLHAALSSLPSPSGTSSGPPPLDHSSDTSPGSLTESSYLQGIGSAATHAHLLRDILPALNHQARSPRYFGFVTGGVLPIAEAADNLVSGVDQNVQVHFPPPPATLPTTPGDGGKVAAAGESGGRGDAVWAHSACTAVEDAALRMLISLCELDGSGVLYGQHGHGHGHPDTTSASGGWPGRTFTTGATAANILGLACGREAVVNRRLAALANTNTDTDTTATVADLGLLAACRLANIRSIQVLTSMGHSSLSKAASVVGLGHASVKEVGLAAAGEPWRLDLDAVERELARSEGDEGVVSIVVVSAGEVNTGRFATHVFDMPKLRSLADRYGAWIHVDGAFGLFARALPKTDEFLSLHAQVAGLELADSIAADGHKLLNVPYDCGIFLCRSATILTQVCSNPNAAYLTAPGTTTTNAILSPLNVGLENSRRFRALPVYAVLLSEGRAGIAAMLARMAHLARRIAALVRASPHYEWLPEADASLEGVFVIVLFRAREEALNEVLVDRINATGRMFVSGTRWEGRKAVRLAVGSWRVDVERDAAVVGEVLDDIAEGRL